MNKKRTSLIEALHKSEKEIISETNKTDEKNINSDTIIQSYSRPPSRRGKKPLTVYVDPTVIKQLKMIGVEKDLTNQDMVIDALNDFFVKHGKPPIG